MPKIEQRNVNDMNLYEYIITTFERHFDLTEGRFMTLNRLMNACNGRYVNVGQFKEFFGLNDFASILEFIDNMDNLDTLINYGKICLKDHNDQLEYSSQTAVMSL